MGKKAKDTKEIGQAELTKQQAEINAYKATDKAKRVAEWPKLDKRSLEPRHEHC